MRKKSTFDLEPAIGSLARGAELGELRHVYHAKQYTSNAIGGGIIYIMFGVFCIAGAILAPILGPLFPTVLIAVPGLFFLIMGGYLLVPRRIYTRWHVYVWDAGFLYQKGSLCQVFRWEQIDTIRGTTAYSPQQGSTFFTYKVRRQDGYVVNLNNTFPDIALIDIVLEEFARQAAARELTMVPPRYRKFADFTLDRQGISDTQGTLSWQEVQELTIEKGTMAVLKRETVLSDHELGHG